MSKSKKPQPNLSYESDGKMGKRNDGKSKQKKDAEFFNVTQNSE